MKTPVELPYLLPGIYNSYCLVYTLIKDANGTTVSIGIELRMMIKFGLHRGRPRILDLN